MSVSGPTSKLWLQRDREKSCNISQSKQQTCPAMTHRDVQLASCQNGSTVPKVTARWWGHLHGSVRPLKLVVTSRLSLAALVGPVQWWRAASGVDRSHAKVAEAGIVRAGLLWRIAVLFRVDGSLVGRVRVDVHVWVATRWTRRTMLTVDRRFCRIYRLISTGFGLLLLWNTAIQFTRLKTATTKLDQKEWSSSPTSQTGCDKWFGV